jgi:hypothetical protein
VVLDVDPRHGGDASLAKLLRANSGLLPPTAEQQTGSGGRHIVFAYPEVEVKNSAGRLGSGLDVRGNGGYIVAPPSRHISGATYTWIAHPFRVPLATMPQWLLNLLVEKPEGGTHFRTSGHRVPEGSRNNHLVSLAGSLRRQGEGRAYIEKALLAENVASCDPPLDPAEVRRIARSVARYGTAPLHVWRDLIRSERGPKNPVTRHILQNLGTYMDANGGHCFPSIKTQSIETGLSERTIKRRLHDAEKGRWLYIFEHQGQGKGWRHYEYQARIPDAIDPNDQRTSDGGDRQSIGGVREAPDTPIYGH